MWRLDFNGHRLKTLRFFPGLLLAVFTGSCATMPGTGLINPGDQVAFIASAIGHDGQTIPIRNQAIGTDSRVGIASGALVGAAWGISCGPLFWFCSPVGALMGAAGGGATGFIVGAAEGLGKERGELLTRGVTDFLRSNDIRQQLTQAVSHRGGEHWKVTEPPAEKHIMIELEYMGLETLRKERVELVIRAAVTVQSANLSERTPGHTRKFDYRSSPSHVNSWIENHNDFIRLRFEDGYKTLAENIVMELTSGKNP